MKKLIILALIAAAAWYGWDKYGRSAAKPSSSPDRTPAANAGHRIDSLSGAAPE